MDAELEFNIEVGEADLYHNLQYLEPACFKKPLFTYVQC